MNEQLEDRLGKILERPHEFQVILNEDVNQEVFEEFDIEEPKRTLGNFNSQPVTIITLKKYNGNYFGLFKHGGEIVGWTMLFTSYPIYPKRLETAKLDIESFQTHPFNREMGIKKDLILALKDRLLTSKAFVRINDELLEMVYLKGRFQGYVLSENLHKAIPMDQECTIKVGDKRYRDSNFDVELPPKEQDFEAAIKLYFRERDLAKVEQGEWTFWVKASDLSYDFDAENSSPEAIEEDVHFYYSDERKKAKAVIRGLVNRQIHLEREVDRTHSRLNRIESLYKNLKESKLGKIQVAIWKRKKRSGE